MTQYPGPDDPFSRPPNEDGTKDAAEPPAPPPPPAPAAPAPPPPPPVAGTDETAPIQREELGYWEKQALEKQQAGAGDTPQPPPGYQQNPTSAQGYGDTPGTSGEPEPTNPWAGYGEPAAYGQPAAPPPATPPPPTYGYAQPAYAQPAYGAYAAPVPAHPRATTALVLGLIGLIGGCLCGVPALAAPFAWSIGAKAKREIRESNGALGGEGNAQAGFIMGIIGTVVLAVVIIGVILLVIGLAVSGSSSGGGNNF